MAKTTGQNPRYEFRTFGQNFDTSIRLMKELSAPVPEEFRERISDEIYIISKSSTKTNIKIRDEKLDIKTLISFKNGLEQWEPFVKKSFPVSKSFLTGSFFPAVSSNIPPLEGDHFDPGMFFEIIREHPDLKSVHVKKQRFGHMVNDTICEFAYVWINKIKVVTISTESTETTDVLKTINDLQLTGFENINYPEAIKRVLGMTNKPLMNQD